MAEALLRSKDGRDQQPQEQEYLLTAYLRGEDARPPFEVLPDIRRVSRRLVLACGCLGERARALGSALIALYTVIPSTYIPRKM